MLESLASVVGNQSVIWSIVALLALWATWSGLALWRSANKVRRSAAQVRDLIKSYPDEFAFAAEFQTVAEALRTDAILGGPWREFRNTLVLRQSPRPCYRATTRASQWFDLGLLRTAGADLRYHGALPNLLVGAGLLFTFLGLALALSSAGSVVTGEAAQRNAALTTLLSTASFKFFTSLAGLLLSIVYALCRTGLLRAVEAEIGRLNDALERRIPLIAPAELQQEANELLQRQYENTQAFANELAVNLGQALDGAFDKRLQQHLGPLTEILEKLGDRLSSHSENAMQSMIESFVKNLQGGATDQMRGVATNLQGLGMQLGDIQGALAQAAARMTEAADAMGQRMGAGADAALGRITAHMDQLASQLAGLSESSRQAGQDALSALVERIDRTAGGFEATAARMAAAIEASASQTGTALGRGADEAVQRIAIATEAMRDQMRLLLDEFKAAAASAGESFRAGSAAGAEALKETLDGAGESVVAALQKASASLSQAGEHAGRQLSGGGEAAKARLEEAGAGFGSQAGSLASRIGQLGESAAALAARAVELEKVAAAATTPLAASTAELRKSSDAVLAATAPLREVAGAIGQAAERLDRLGNRLDSLQARTDQLAAGLKDAAGRFEGVDETLASVLRELNTSLQTYQDQVRQVVTEVDRHFAKAVDSFGGAVNDLGGSVEDLRDILATTAQARADRAHVAAGG